MNNNVLATIPQVASLLRVNEPYPQKKVRSDFGDYLDKSNPQNFEFWNGWMEEARQGVKNGIQSFQTAQKRLLFDRTQPEKGPNKAQQPFYMNGQSNSDVFNSKVNNQYSGSGFSAANISEVARLNNNEANIVREQLLERRRNEFAELSGTPLLPPSGPSGPSDVGEEKLNNDLLLASIEERVFSKVIDSSVFSDFSRIIFYFSKNVYKYDSNEFFNNILNRLDYLAKGVYNVIELLKYEEGGKSFPKDIQLSQALYDAIARLVKFLKANAEYVGRTEKERLTKQQATAKLLTKINQTENTESRFNARLQELQQNYNLEKYNIFDINFIGKAVGLTERAKSENTQRYVFLIYNKVAFNSQLENTLSEAISFLEFIEPYKLNESTLEDLNKMAYALGLKIGTVKETIIKNIYYKLFTNKDLQDEFSTIYLEAPFPTDLEDIL